MQFKKGSVKHWFDTFKRLKSFEIFTKKEVIDLYNDSVNHIDAFNSQKIKSEKYSDKKGLDGMNRDYWIVQFKGEDDLNNGVVDKFYLTNNGVGGERSLSLEKKDGHIKQSGFAVSLNADIIQYQDNRYSDNQKFVYLEIPCDFFNRYTTTNQLEEEPYVDYLTEERNIDNKNLEILKQFIEEVESSPVGWKPSNFIPIVNKYDKRYPSLLKHETRQNDIYFKWRQNFSIISYISIKEFGLAFPIWTQNNNNIFYDGIHRVVGTFLSKKDVPVFIRVDDTLDGVFSATTPKIFNGKFCNLKIDLSNKEIKYFIDNKEVGYSK
ncbi:hypothetical protein CMI47_00070 [Candidatus Pacearchaeota archaeon]|nr:hypothetical protein [Candidatus Pacearchaeota archaeon]